MKYFNKNNLHQISFLFILIVNCIFLCLLLLLYYVPVVLSLSHAVYSYPLLVFLLLECVTLFGLCTTTNALLEDSNTALVFLVWTVLEPEE